MAMRVGYTEAFKMHVVREVEEGKITQVETSRRYGILGHSTILKWCRKYGRLKFTRSSGTKRMVMEERDIELLRLQNEVHELKQELEGSLKALRMALKNRSHRETRLIHHSDRGIQYCCEEYITLLERNGIQISMSAPGNPYENAVAERVNNTVKTEFYLDGFFRNIGQVQKALKETVFVYNNERPHASCDYLTPDQAHQQQGVLKKRWRTYKPKVQPQKINGETQKALEQLMAKIQ